MLEPATTQPSHPWEAEQQQDRLPLAPTLSEQACPVPQDAISGRARWLETVSDRDVTAVSAELDLPQPVSSSSGMYSSASPGFANSLGGLLHDARNLVTTLDLYCDLLDMPGVLEAPSHHYAGELRLIAEASRRILEKLSSRSLQPGPEYSQSTGALESERRLSHGLTIAAADLETSDVSRMLSNRKRGSIRPLPGTESVPCPATSSTFQRISATVESLSRGARWRPFVATVPIQNLAEEVLANHNLLCALAGPGITVGLSIYDGKRPVPLSGDELTRILVNLVKNAAEAMPDGGHIQVALQEFEDHLSLSVSDTGTGIPESAQEAIFTAGYTTHVAVTDPFLVESGQDSAGRQTAQHGMGLAIVRSIMEAAGGSATAANRRDGPAALLCESGAYSRKVSSALPVTGAVIRLRFPTPS